VEIDRASATPPYQQVAGQLRARIVSGEIAPGSRLPSAETIVQETGIARMTARKALKALRDAGYAYVSSGMGTYVRPREQWPQP
jgi:GntR family transcriptional regulator